MAEIFKFKRTKKFAAAADGLLSYRYGGEKLAAAGVIALYGLYQLVDFAASTSLLTSSAILVTNKLAHDGMIPTFLSTDSLFPAHAPQIDTLADYGAIGGFAGLALTRRAVKMVKPIKEILGELDDYSNPY